MDVPNSGTYLNWTPISKWYVIWCNSKNRYKIRLSVFTKKNLSTCSKYDSDSNLNSQHDWREGDLQYMIVQLA